MNKMAEYLRFYDREMGPQPTSRIDSPNMSSQALAQLNNAEGFNARGARLTGALALMDQVEGGQRQQPAPNFFANDMPQPAAPAYVQPGPAVAMPQMRERTAPQGNPEIRNYLAQFLTRGR